MATPTAGGESKMTPPAPPEPAPQASSSLLPDVAPPTPEQALIARPAPRPLGPVAAKLERAVLKVDRPYVWPAGAAVAGAWGLSRLFAVGSNPWNLLLVVPGLLMLVFCLWANERRKARISELVAAIEQQTSQHAGELHDAVRERDDARATTEVVNESLGATQAWIDDLIKKLVTRVAYEFHLGPAERLTILRYTDRELIIVGRHCDNDEYDAREHSDLRKQRFDRNYGVMGRALSRGKYSTSFDPQATDYVDYDQWQLRYGRLPELDLADLGMRSRQYRAEAIYNSAGDRIVGMIVLESLDATTDRLAELFDALDPDVARGLEPAPALTETASAPPGSTSRPAASSGLDAARDKRTREQIVDLLELLATMPTTTDEGGEVQ